MKILMLADHESKYLYDYYRPGMLKEYDLILSAGDLNSRYLSFLVTMARCPLLYVHGNHDGSYEQFPPEGCDCIDGKLVTVNGLRILGLGGSRCYNRGPYQYTERQMRHRIRRMTFPLYRAGGVDLILTHAPVRGFGDLEDLPHRGFEAFQPLLDKYHPKYFVHGHVHMNYGSNLPRTRKYGDTTLINCYEKYVIEI